VSECSDSTLGTECALATRNSRNQTCVGYAKPNMRWLRETKHALATRSRTCVGCAKQAVNPLIQLKPEQDVRPDEAYVRSRYYRERYEPRPACPRVCFKSSPKAIPKPSPKPARQGSEGDTGKGGSAPRVLGKVALGSILSKLTENFSSLTTCPL
jgi:hypothetical protein